MRPTTDLRFVKRKLWREETDVSPEHAYECLVLQQKWVHGDGGVHAQYDESGAYIIGVTGHEWRDVEVCDE